MLVRVGLALWLIASLACVWEVLALQPPDSPFHLGVLAGPIVQLRTFAFGLGAISLIAAALWPCLYAPGKGRPAAVLLSAGALAQVGLLGYAASRGLLAVQIFDPRADARFTLYGRALAHAWTLIGLSALLFRALRSLRAERPPS